MSEKKLANFERLTLQDRLKYEVAQELGLLDKVIESGWQSLSAKDAGRIGGVVAKRKKELQKKKEF